MSLDERLRAVAARLCSATTMERLIDPALTDVQVEHQDAIGQGRRWRSRWIRMVGYFAFLKIMALCAYQRTVADWNGDEGRAFARTVMFSGAAFLGTVLLLISPPALHRPAKWLPYLFPQALPFAIPVGITLGVFCGLGGRVVPVRVKTAVLALALAGSVGSLAVTAWMIPAAGRAFRVSLSEHVRLTTGKEMTLTPGGIEMTTDQLHQTIDSLTQSGRPREARKVAFAYNLRWALPGAPFVLALFALAVMPRRRVRRWIPAAAACGACFLYYVFLLAADFVTRQTLLPIAVFVWLPNLALVVASAAFMMAEDKLRPSVPA